MEVTPSADADPDLIGGPNRVRTCDPLDANQALSRLSYGPGVPVTSSGVPRDRQSLERWPLLLSRVRGSHRDGLAPFGLGDGGNGHCTEPIHERGQLVEVEPDSVGRVRIQLLG